MPTKNPRVKVTLSPELVEALESHPDYQPERRGLRSGLSGLIVALVSQSLGLEEPSDAHRQQAAKWERYRAEKESSV